jgi:hypothetical protein
VVLIDPLAPPRSLLAAPAAAPATATSRGAGEAEGGGPDHGN